MYGIVDCGSLLWYLQNEKIIEILGTAYYHPVLPLVPQSDWDEQLERWQGLGAHLFGRDRFDGCWPPELGFCMELIPALRRGGYRYVIVDFAGSDAKFTTAFAQRGLIAEHGISWLLPRLVGPANALDLLLSARKATAAEAERMGLVNKVFEQTNFMGAVMDYAKALAETVSPRSMAVMKAQIWKSLFQNFNEAVEIGDAEMQKSFATADFKEGVAHFVEKRKANFTGR